MTPADYLKLPYCRILIPEDDGGYSAEILEFTGCLEYGDTPNETIERLERMAASWIAACQSRGIPIPEPTTYSQRHNLREYKK